MGAIKNRNNIKWNQIVAYISGNFDDSKNNSIKAQIAEGEIDSQIYNDAENVWHQLEHAKANGINVKHALNKVSQRINLPKESKLKQLSSIKYFVRIAAIFILGIFTWFVINNFNSKIIVNSGNNLMQISLSDGSVIDLNKHTQIIYPKTFKGTSREIRLKGEAFFSIARNPSKPFIIHTSKTNIKVLGTSFNVNSIDNGDVEVIVRTGTVSVASNVTKKLVILHKDEKINYIAQSGEMEKSLNPDPNFLFWKTHKLIFNETILANVFSTLEKAYNIKIEVQNPVINQCKLTATYENLNANEVMQMIDLTFGLKTINSNNFFTIIGTNCKSVN
jgi:ferric-dicitrate binding protein FerR (iron transport regulator)